METKKNYFIECSSADIAFCNSDCKNKKCSRNLKSKTAQYKGMYFTVASLGDVCTQYKK